MFTNRDTLRQKIKDVVMLISIPALVLAMAIGLIGMLIIRNTVMVSGHALGNQTAGDSKEALTNQMEQNLLTVIREKANLATEKFTKYEDFVWLFTNYASQLYDNGDTFSPAVVLPPDKQNEGAFSLQRYLLSQEIDLAQVQEEIGLLGNLVNVFAPVLKDHEDIITTVYVSAASGFLISYDKNAAAGDTGQSEEYFDFSGSTWFVDAKSSGTAVFTDTYLDSYGRGLTMTIAAPFYHNGIFKGVIGMDILLSDINQSIIDIDISSDSHAFIIDSGGNIIASPMMDNYSDDFVNIRRDSTSAVYPVAEQLLSGDTDIIQANGYYFAYTPINISSWTLAIQVPVLDVTQPALDIGSGIMKKMDDTVEMINRSIINISLVFIVGLSIILFFSVEFSKRFSRRLTDPLLALQRDVHNISKGNLDHRAEIMSRDEIGDLAHEFNAMAESLQEYIRNFTAATAEKERISAELDVAKKIQTAMIPSIFPPYPDREEFDIFASMTPAKEVGGDFYDFFFVDDDTLAVVIADVSGKGIPAALFMVITKTLIKNNAQMGKSPKEVFEVVNNTLFENNEARMFVTGILGYLHLQTGEFTYVNAGHNAPILFNGGEISWVKNKPNFILAGMGNSLYKEHQIMLHQHDALLFYTDGVTEAMNRTEELFGDLRLFDAVAQYRQFPMKSLIPSIKEDVKIFTDGTEQADDITMLLLYIR